MQEEANTEYRNNIEEQVLRSTTFHCEQCGASLNYKAGTASLHCDYCGSDTPIELKTPLEIIEIDIEEYANNEELLNAQETKIISCRNCGAESVVDESLKSTHCLYCKSPLIEEDIHHVRMLQPSYMLPFKVEQANVNKLLIKWVKSLWYAPNKLKREILTSTDIQGTYIPCWTYDADTFTLYKGMRGKYYTVTTGSGEKKKTETRTSWSYRSGQLSIYFDDVLISGSKMIDQKCLNELAIKGWDTENLVSVNNQLMSGFITEKYTVTLHQGLEIAKSIIDSKVKSAIRSDIGGDEQRILGYNTLFNQIKFKLILLPNYISFYTYRNKTYKFYVNGRNGDIIGKRPYSIIKILFSIIIMAIIFYGIFYYLSLD